MPTSFYTPQGGKHFFAWVRGGGNRISSTVFREMTMDSATLPPWLFHGKLWRILLPPSFCLIVSKQNQCLPLCCPLCFSVSTLLHTVLYTVLPTLFFTGGLQLFHGLIITLNHSYQTKWYIERNIIYILDNVHFYEHMKLNMIY